jgi:hypothetical protein
VFGSEDENHWVLHQLCTHKDAANLERTGDLYKWRAEYLAGQKGDVRISGWFSSKGRWLERLLVKFDATTSSKVELQPVKVQCCIFEKLATSDGRSTRRVKIGEFDRFVFRTESVQAAYGPSRWNIGRLLDFILLLGSDGESSGVAESAQSLIAASGRESGEFMVTTRAEAGVVLPNVTKQFQVDRFMTFSKSAIEDFIFAVDYTVAVSIRKQTIGAPRQ